MSVKDANDTIGNRTRDLPSCSPVPPPTAHAPYCHLWPDQLYSVFPHYLVNATIVQKGFLNVKCVFWFALQSLSQTVLILRRKKRDMSKMSIGLHAKYLNVKYPLFLSDCKDTLRYRHDEMTVELRLAIQHSLCRERWLNTALRDTALSVKVVRLICGNKMPTRRNRGFYCRSYCLLNMFRAPLCPSSGAKEYYTVVAACGISCSGFQVAGLVWS